MKNDITAAGLVLAYVPIKNIGISSFNRKGQPRPPNSNTIGARITRRLSSFILILQISIFLSNPPKSLVQIR